VVQNAKKYLAIQSRGPHCFFDVSKNGVRVDKDTGKINTSKDF